jgi:uncharacterized delta-60 repeat protein
MPYSGALPGSGPHMRLFGALPVAAMSIACALAAPASAAPGALDPSFAGVGWTRTLEVYAGDMNYLPRGAQAVAVQPDGAIVTAGTVHDANSNLFFGVFRHLPDGRLDPAFGTGGFTIVDAGSFEEARALALQPDGKIVVAGETTCTTSRCFTVLRLNPDGSLDGGFGAGGIVRQEFRLEASWAHAAAIDPDGRIVLAGTILRGSDGQDSAHVCVLRLLPDGRLDASFSRDGIAVLDHGYGNDSAEAIALQGRRVVVAGEGRDTAAGARFGVARFRRDGRLDRSFGVRGHRLVGFGARRHASAHAVAVSPGGGLVVAGSATVEEHAPQVALARLDRDGGLDRRFGGDGRVRTSPGPHGGNGRAVAILADGGIVAGGRAFAGAVFGSSDWALLGYTRRGRLDRSFGAGGVARADFGTGEDEVAALAVAGGGIVVAGTIYASHGIARFLTS